MSGVSAVTRATASAIAKQTRSPVTNARPIVSKDLVESKRLVLRVYKAWCVCIVVFNVFKLQATRTTKTLGRHISFELYSVGTIPSSHQGSIYEECAHT